MCAERVLPTYDDDDRPAVMIDRGPLLTDFAAAAEMAGWLFEPSEAANLARVVNHFTHGMTYTVIEDPDAFTSAYREARAAEDPDAPVNIHGYQLTKFAMPDLSRIASPRLEDGRLVFYAVDEAIGVPYRVEARVNRAGIESVVYESLPPAP